MVEIVWAETVPIGKDFDPNPFIQEQGGDLYQNDCLLRNAFTFASFTSLDEIIVPQASASLLNYLEADMQKDPNIGAWVFKHAALYYNADKMTHFKLEKQAAGQGAYVKKADNFNWRNIDFQWLTTANARTDIMLFGKPVGAVGRPDRPVTHGFFRLNAPYIQKQVRKLVRVKLPTGKLRAA